MYTTALRKVGGSVMLTVPPSFLDQLELRPGATVGLLVADGRLIIEPAPRPRYVLADLLNEMPAGLPQVEGWDAMPNVGLENV